MHSARRNAIPIRAIVGKVLGVAAMQHGKMPRAAYPSDAMPRAAHSEMQQCQVFAVLVHSRFPECPVPAKSLFVAAIILQFFLVSLFENFCALPSAFRSMSSLYIHV